MAIVQWKVCNTLLAGYFYRAGDLCQCLIRRNHNTPGCRAAPLPWQGYQLHHFKKFSLERHLYLALESPIAQIQFLHGDTVSHHADAEEVLQPFLSRLFFTAGDYLINVKDHEQGQTKRRLFIESAHTKWTMSRSWMEQRRPFQCWFTTHGEKKALSEKSQSHFPGLNSIHWFMRGKTSTKST